MAFFSTSSKDYTGQIKDLTKPTYASKYNNVIEQNLNNILNNKPFSYDFNADPLYKNYKEMYRKQGKEAGLSAQAAAAANTGGYGNSYGVTAGTEANMSVMSQLADRIPELYNAAQTQYQNNLNNNYNKLQTLQSEESRLYNQYRDIVGDYYSDWENLQSGYDIAKNQENTDRAFNYMVERDKILDARYAAEKAYQESRDSESDRRWQIEYQQALSRI